MGIVSAQAVPSSEQVKLCFYARGRTGVRCYSEKKKGALADVYIPIMRKTGLPSAAAALGGGGIEAFVPAAGAAGAALDCSDI